MKIPGATSGVSATGKSDSTVEWLQKQRSQLVDQLQKVKESKADAKTKQEKIKELTERIAQLDSQIQQAEIASRQKELREVQEKSAEKAEEEKLKQQAEQGEDTGVVLAPSLDKVINLQKNMREYRNLGAVRNKLKGEMQVAQSQIDHASARSSIKYQADVIANNTTQLDVVEQKMAKTAGEVRKGVKRSAELGAQEAEIARKHKDQETEEANTTGAETAGMTEGNEADTAEVLVKVPTDGPDKREQESDQDREEANKQKSINIQA